MAQRINTCKKCESWSLKTIREIDPDTIDMNMSVIMTCEDCGHTDTYYVTSPKTAKLRKAGWIR